MGAIEPLIPPAKRGGNKRTVEMRAAVDGLMYVPSTGCQRRALPKDLPACSTVDGYFDLWDDDGTLLRIHHALFVRCREQAPKRTGSENSIRSADTPGTFCRAIDGG